MNLYTTYTREEINILKSLSNKTPINFEYNKLLEIVEHIPILNSIPENVLGKIVTDIKILKYQKDETVIKENQNGDEIFYIVTGSVSVYKNSRKISTLKSKKIFGEMAAILNKPRNATIITNEDKTTIISFKIDFSLIKSDLAYYFAIIYKNLAITLSEKIEEDNKQLMEK